MSSCIAKYMNLEKPKRLIISDGESSICNKNHSARSYKARTISDDAVSLEGSRNISLRYNCANILPMN